MKRDKILMTSLARHDDFNTSTTFQLSRRFQEENDVLIIEHPYTWSELLKNANTAKGKLRLKATFSSKPIIREKGGVAVMVPPATIPINFLPKGAVYDRLQWINQSLLSLKINNYLRSYKWDEYYFINSYNYHFPRLADLLAGNPLKKVYHCVDPIVKAYTKKHGIENERKSVINADMVISTAPSLAAKWEALTESHLVPNAVDFDHFNRPLKTLKNIRELGSKVIGYFGNIERRIDFPLLIDTFTNHPEWHLLLAGNVEEQYVPKAIHGLKNVHFLHSYQYEALPDMLHSVDALLIPFKCDEASKAIYPLKLYEYFSVGKPVITTHFNPDILHKIKNETYLVEEEKPLSAAIADALQEDSPLLAEKRKQIASENTWHHRANKFINLLKNNNHGTEDKGTGKAIPTAAPRSKEPVFTFCL